MKDDFAWGVCYGMDGKVRKGLSHGEEEPVAIKIAYLSLGPEVEKPATYSSHSSLVCSGLPRDRGYMILR